MCDEKSLEGFYFFLKFHFLYLKSRERDISHSEVHLSNCYQQLGLCQAKPIYLELNWSHPLLPHPLRISKKLESEWSRDVNLGTLMQASQLAS